MNRRWWWILGGLALALVLAMTMSPGSEEPGNQEGPELVQLRRDPTLKDRDSLAQAEHAERVAEQVNGVDEAWVAVVDNKAYVGLQLGEGVDGERAERIERTVAEQIVSRVDEVNQALVSRDPAVASRMREISQDLAEGRPASTYREELERLGSRMRARLHE